MSFIVRFCSACMAFAIWAFVIPATAQSVAFTFDDGPKTVDTPLLSPQQRNQAILDALAKHHVKAALFVTAGNGANTPEGYALAKAWGQAGQAIGNHTITHLDLNDDRVSLEQYQKEVIDCDNIIKTLPGYRKWFRYTFLREGNTVEKRDGMRAFLIAHDYRNATVSLDTSDWRFEAKLLQILKKNSHADIEPIRQAYLAHVRQRALAYRQLSLQLQGRDIAQVILLHHTLLNALWLDDILAQFEGMGWKFVTPAEAYADAVYQLMPEIPVSGQSLLLLMANSMGLGNFPDRKRLVDDGDFEMDELTKIGM